MLCENNSFVMKLSYSSICHNSVIHITSLSFFCHIKTINSIADRAARKVGERIIALIWLYLHYSETVRNLFAATGAFVRVDKRGAHAAQIRLHFFIAGFADVFQKSVKRLPVTTHFEHCESRASPAAKLASEHARFIVRDVDWSFAELAERSDFHNV